MLCFLTSIVVNICCVMLCFFFELFKQYIAFQLPGRMQALFGMALKGLIDTLYWQQLLKLKLLKLLSGRRQTISSEAPPETEEADRTSVTRGIKMKGRNPDDNKNWVVVLSRTVVFHQIWDVQEWHVFQMVYNHQSKHQPNGPVTLCFAKRQGAVSKDREIRRLQCFSCSLNAIWIQPFSIGCLGKNWQIRSSRCKARLLLQR